MTWPRRAATWPNWLYRYTGFGAALLITGDYSTAALLADRILDLAQREGSPASLGFACHAQIDVSFYRGDLVGAEDSFSRLSGLP